MVRASFWKSIAFLGALEVWRDRPHKWLVDGESRLLRQIRRGDDAAFDELILKWRPSLVRYMERRVPTDAVEDVIQETILSAWSNVSQFDETRSFKLWLLGIAQNKSRDFWRKNFGRNETLEDWELFEGNSYLQLDFEDVELIQVLAGAWSELTPSMREVLELYYGQELKLPEISLLLNTNLNTIKHRFYRAHAMLAENFDAESIQALMKPRSQNTRHGEHGHIRRGR